MLKKFGSFACALAMGAALLPAAALADDPRDATMRNPAVRARSRDHPANEPGAARLCAPTRRQQRAYLPRAAE